MAAFNILLHGSPREVIAEIDIGDLSESEIRAALINAFTRLARIEDTLAAKEKP